MKEEGYSEEQISTIHAPIGLKIGARTPEEIAISIAAEMIAIKNHETESTMSKELLKQKNQECYALSQRNPVHLHEVSEV